MNTYKAFFNGKTLEVKAPTSFEAQTKAIELFKPSKKQSHMVTVVLIAKEDKEVLVSPCSLPGA